MNGGDVGKRSRRAVTHQKPPGPGDTVHDLPQADGGWSPFFTHLRKQTDPFVDLAGRGQELASRLVPEPGFDAPRLVDAGRRRSFPCGRRARIGGERPEAYEHV